MIDCFILFSCYTPSMSNPYVFKRQQNYSCSQFFIPIHPKEIVINWWHFREKNTLSHHRQVSKTKNELRSHNKQCPSSSEVDTVIFVRCLNYTSYRALYNKFVLLVFFHTRVTSCFWFPGYHRAIRSEKSIMKISSLSCRDNNLRCLN